jgi:hypothetical protein
MKGILRQDQEGIPHFKIQHSIFDIHPPTSKFKIRYSIFKIPFVSLCASLCTSV